MRITIFVDSVVERISILKQLGEQCGFLDAGYSTDGCVYLGDRMNIYFNNNNNSLTIETKSEGVM